MCHWMVKIIIIIWVVMINVLKYLKYKSKYYIVCRLDKSLQWAKQKKEKEKIRSWSYELPWWIYRKANKYTLLTAAQLKFHKFLLIFYFSYIFFPSLDFVLFAKPNLIKHNKSKNKAAKKSKNLYFNLKTASYHKQYVIIDWFDLFSFILNLSRLPLIRYIIFIYLNFIIPFIVCSNKMNVRNFW